MHPDFKKNSVMSLSLVRKAISMSCRGQQSKKKKNLASFGTLTKQYFKNHIQYCINGCAEYLPQQDSFW
jgi:hypothetical protein